MNQHAVLKPLSSFPPFIYSALFRFWILLLGVDMAETVYAVGFLGFRELNPLGYPLCFIVLLPILAFFYIVAKYRPRTKLYLSVSLLLLCMTQIRAIISNLLVLFIQ